MKFKNENGREAGLRSIHQMMGNPGYEVVEIKESDGTPERVVLRDESGNETEWTKTGEEKEEAPAPN